MKMSTFEFLGETFSIRLAQPAWFVFGVRKSGSTMLNEAVRYLAQRNDANWVSIPDQLFLSNVDLEGDFSSYIPSRLIHPGNVYGGFRSFPRSLLATPEFVRGRKVLLVRDPRDALVSQYFSLARSHYIPAGSSDSGPRKKLVQLREHMSAISIDDFALLEAAGINDTMLTYSSLLRDSGALILRYEDVIYNKSELLTLLCDHFGWELSAEGRNDILHHIDIRPEAEDVNAFVRKVTPGDYLEKLKPETIEAVNVLVAEAMATFSYNRVSYRPLHQQLISRDQR